jgi:hypothetical protein
MTLNVKRGFSSVSDPACAQRRLQRDGYILITTITHAVMLITI